MTIATGATAHTTDADDAVAREVAIGALVDRWTTHMRWRKDYDRWREDRMWQEETQIRRLHAIERFAGDLAGKRVLDIGSGMGGFLVAAAVNSGAHAVGIEPNADYGLITRLRAARYRRTPALARAVGEHLPFAAASFDVVLAQDILEHVGNPDDVLREIARVLRPSGVALVTAINRLAWHDPHYHLYGINYLPRAVAERIIIAVKRGKRRTAFTDAQRLSAMYYDSFTGFAHRAGAAGLAVTDVREASVRDSNRMPTGARGYLVARARRMGIALPLYRAYRFAALGTFECVLRPLDERDAAHEKAEMHAVQDEGE